jgi:hypothetical protein
MTQHNKSTNTTRTMITSHRKYHGIFGRTETCGANAPNFLLIPLILSI